MLDTFYVNTDIYIISKSDQLMALIIPFYLFICYNKYGNASNGSPEVSHS